MKKLRDRFIGTLMGTAVGDALGHPFEGWFRDQIESRVGRVTELIADFPPYHLAGGQYTDDTQLTIAIAESLVRSNGFDLDDLIARFIDWLNEPPIGPGYGCLTSIEDLRKGVPWQNAASRSGGNGTAMRVSPIGLFFHKNIPRLVETARQSSVITHSHWAATASAIVVARSVAYLVNCETLDVDDFLQEVATAVDQPEFDDFANNIRKLKSYLKNDTIKALFELGSLGIKPPWPNPALETGRGFIAAYAMSTTLAALFCFLLSPDDFENSVIEAVMAGGDTDTCGAITGAISGSYNGLSKIPSNWVKNVVNTEKIVLLGNELFEATEKR